MHINRRTPVRVIAATRARVATVSRSTWRKPIPVPSALTTASQPSKARRTRVASSRASPLDQLGSRQVGARFRTNQRHYEVTALRGVADGQAWPVPPVAPKTSIFMFDLDLF